MVENEIYKRLKTVHGVPKVLHFAVEGDYNCMVMEALGPSMEDLHKFCHRKFTIKTGCMIALQMLDRIEAIHS